MPTHNNIPIETGGNLIVKMSLLVRRNGISSFEVDHALNGTKINVKILTENTDYGLPIKSKNCTKPVELCIAWQQICIFFDYIYNYNVCRVNTSNVQVYEDVFSNEILNVRRVSDLV